jgi:hypothetical protein
VDAKGVFSSGELLQGNLKIPGTNKTFYQDAIERYVTQQPAGAQKLSPVEAMEEADCRAGQVL